MTHKFIHYLRNERRRKALSQADVAALFGGRWKGRISKYERGVVPPTPVAIDYEIILHKPVSDLLGGVTDAERVKVRRNARELLRSERAPNTPRRWLRHKTLEQIAA
jgi:transcriptional regulator with XRE-family HTH domain